MYFYKVWPGDMGFHGEEPLTYQSEARLAVGTVVCVPLRAKTVAGIVAAESSKPAFATKPVAAALPYVLPAASLKLLEWLRTYYPAPAAAIAGLFVAGKLPSLPQKSLIEIQHKLDSFSVRGHQTAYERLTLTAEQSDVFSTVVGKPGAGTFLLHGETGSGKTRVYTELTRHALEAGRSAIILTPEISLTPQLVRAFIERFGDRVLATHSKMTDVERRNVWLEILESNARNVPRVVIGPRSALFAPLDRLGLIVIDEAHETAYKQEQAPRYHAARVAATLSALHQAALVLGTATPSVQDFYTATALGLPILRMREQAVVAGARQASADGNTSGDALFEAIAAPGSSTTPAADDDAAAGTATVEIVDIRDKTLFVQHRYVSVNLLSGMRQSLERGEQVLLFLNRRGTARLVMCDNCGWQALCPECDLPLTYHGDKHLMLCHTCGHRESTPSSCPECHSSAVIFRSFGTKALADFIQHQFPGKTVARFDMDNTRDERLESRYDELLDGRIDIIVGTQLLAKGLDLPRLGFVGVVLADTSLYIPDYSSDERTYQLLYQVIGRVGRGHRRGHVVIQSYNPDNLAIQAAITKDWAAFYESQLEERRHYNFPPFVYLLKLTCNRKSPAAAEKAARSLKNQLLALRLPVIIEGPAPAFREKAQGTYQWQLIVKAKKRPILTGIIPHLPAHWTYDLDPANLL